MIPKHRYKYLVSYVFKDKEGTGHGSMVLDCKFRIINRKSLNKIAKYLKQYNKCDAIGITNYILMS